MLGFLIKKSFWDLWDNMGRIILINLMFTLLIFGFYVTTLLAQYSILLATISLIVLLLIIFIYLGATASYIKGLNDFRPDEIKTFFQNIKVSWKKSISGGFSQS
jgi:predicted neutral ceramidase superfamily lipid hydrolase